MLKLRPSYERQKSRIVMLNDSMWKALEEIKEKDRQSISESIRLAIEDYYLKWLYNEDQNGSAV